MSDDERAEFVKLVSLFDSPYLKDMPMKAMCDAEARLYHWEGAPNADFVLGGKFYVTVRRRDGE